jgi:hypothetical protein
MAKEKRLARLRPHPKRRTESGVEPSGEPGSRMGIGLGLAGRAAHSYAGAPSSPLTTWITKLVMLSFE